MRTCGSGADHLSAGKLQSFSLRAKLLVFVAILVLVPGGIYGAIAVSSSRAALARVIGLQLVGEAHNATDRLATTLRSERESLASFAKQDVMREIRIGDLDKRISSFLASLKQGCVACLDLLVLDREGKVVASSNPSLIGRPPAPRQAAARRLRERRAACRNAAPSRGPSIHPIMVVRASVSASRFPIPTPRRARSARSSRSSTGSAGPRSSRACAKTSSPWASTPTCSSSTPRES